MSSAKNLNRRSIAPSVSVGQLTSKDLDALAEVEEPNSPMPGQKSGIFNLGDDVKETGRRSISRSPSRTDIPPVPAVPLESRSPAISRSGSFAKPSTREATPPAAPNGHVNTPPAREETPPPASPTTFTVFLQVGRHVKKVTIDPDSALSFASLRVLFVDRFSYNPGQDNFPSIYIRDGTSGVQYELEDIEEVKSGALLSLNIERMCLWSLNLLKIADLLPDT